MRIEVGYELIYNCSQPTPMVLMLSVHPSRSADLVVEDRLVVDPPIPIHEYRDSFGNGCMRIVAPTGRVRLSARGAVNDPGSAETVAVDLPQHAIEDLPDDTLMFLLASATARRTGYRTSPGHCSGRRPPEGIGSKRSATMSISTLPSVMNMRGQAGRPGRHFAIAPGCAAITRTSRLPFAAA